jgi:hypothetical protein
MEPAPLLSRAEVRKLQSMSALGVLAVSEHLTSSVKTIIGNGTCPTRETSGNTTRYLGGCTNGDGVIYPGEMIEAGCSRAPRTGA